MLIRLRDQRSNVMQKGRKLGKKLEKLVELASSEDKYVLSVIFMILK